MSKRYKTLLSPICIGGRIIKSRFYYPVAQPHFLQGPEPYPGTPVVEYFTRLAKNGAGLMIFQDLTNPEQKNMPGFDTCHFCCYDLDDPLAQNYFTQFTHMVHCCGGVICAEMGLDMRLGYCVNDPEKRSPPRPSGGNPYGAVVGPEGQKAGSAPMRPQRTYLNAETMAQYTDTVIEHLKKYQSVGFDGCMIDLRAGSILGMFLNPHYNVRQDEYGGSFENRSRFPKYFLRRLRQALGEDFMIVCNAPHYGADSEFGPNMPIEEAVRFLRDIEPVCDLLHLSCLGEDHAPDKPETAADMSRDLKELGVRIPVAVNTPYMDLDALERIVAEGKADMIASAHMFICNEDLGDILKTGRGEDLKPCIGCHICRGSSFRGDWMSHCTINPVVGMAHRLSMLQAPPGTRKRVAVIGGGPAGMQCAVLLKKRGHSPVIFEQGPELGGQILTAKYSVRKWELERYRQYLIRQVEEHAIEVHLDTAATPELIRPMGFDAVIAALGAEPRLPPLEITGRQVWNVVNVYPNVEKLGKRVVVVGGASAAAEAANFLAETGREVVELSRKNIVGYDLNPIRMRGYMNHLAEQLGVTVIPNAAVTEIGADCVCFRNAEGKECQIVCDDVVLSGGMTPRAEAAMSFWDCAAEFYVIGDARHAANLRAAITDAYCVAWKI